HEARWVIKRLGHPESFFSEGTARSEHAKFGMTHGEEATGCHGGQDGLTKALTAARARERHRGLPGAGDAPTIGALGHVGEAEEEVRQRMQADIPAGRGECKRTLGSGDGLVIRTHKPEIV